MFSQKFLTAILIIALLGLSYQTYALASLEKKLTQAQINVGGSSTVNLTTNGSAPDMVGGC